MPIKIERVRVFNNKVVMYLQCHVARKEHNEHIKEGVNIRHNKNNPWRGSCKGMYSTRKNTALEFRIKQLH